MVTFHTDDDEVIANVGTGTELDPSVVENAQNPAGIIGFWLNFWQQDCT